MPHRILNQTETRATIKLWGTDESGTVSLATDLLSPTMIVSGTPKANITFLQWSVSGKTDVNSVDVINIKRNGETVIGLFQNSGTIDFAGNGGITEDTNNTSDIAYEIVGTGYAYITVRKVSGYQSKIQPYKFASYDDPNSVNQ